MNNKSSSLIALLVFRKNRRWGEPKNKCPGGLVRNCYGVKKNGGHISLCSCVKKMVCVWLCAFSLMWGKV